MGSRPERPGDTEAYFKCRAIIMGEAEANGIHYANNAPCYARDYGKGAAGDWA